MNPALSNVVLNPMAFNSGEPKSDVQMETMSDVSNFGDAANRKPWMKRPGAPITKVAPEVKRRRRNYQARKLLIPKNPLMILNELKPGLPYVFTEINDNNQTVFVARVEVDGQQFCGKGVNKKQAQQEAAEAALRGLYFDKLLEQLSKKEDGDTEMKDPNVTPVESLYKSHPEDDTPWSGLASLAMFKLVSMWQNPGMVNMPILSTPWSHILPVNAVKSDQAQLPVPPVPIADLNGKIPANAHEIDPVMLLNQLSPHSKFTEQARDIRNGATVFTLTVDFNGNTYNGSATKKKAAKKICAKSALKSVGVAYSEEY